MFQDPYASLNPRMQIGEAIGEVLSVHGLVPRRQIPSRVKELLDIVGILPAFGHRYPSDFSGGQRQRICIARALAAVARRFRSKFVFPVGSLFRLRVSHHLDHATFPAPATSNAACGFPALRAPVCFMLKAYGTYPAGATFGCWSNPLGSH